MNCVICHILPDEQGVETGAFLPLRVGTERRYRYLSTALCCLCECAGFFREIACVLV